MSNPFDQGYYFSQDIDPRGTSRSLNDFGFKAVGRNVRIARNCTIIGLHNISIGNNVRIDGNVTITAASGFLDIGDYVHIGGGSHISAAGGVTFRDFSGVSQGVKIYSGSDDYSGRTMTNPTVPAEYLGTILAPVELGRHAIVGSGSVILPGCSLAEGVAVGALSLVTKSLEEWAVYLGTPAKRIRSRKRHALDMEQQLRSVELQPA